MREHAAGLGQTVLTCIFAHNCCRCVSNIALHKQIASLMPPGAPGISACEDDGDQGFCTCAKCRAWDVVSAGQGPDSLCEHSPGWPHSVGNCTGQYSDRYARFWTAVAAQVAKRAPDAWVTGYAYDNYVDPPVEAKLEGNIMIGLVVFGSYPSLENETAAEQKVWQGWMDAGAKRVFVRPNLSGSKLHGPFQYGKQVTDNLKWAAEHGLSATDFDSLCKSRALHTASKATLMAFNDCICQQTTIGRCPASRTGRLPKLNGLLRISTTMSRGVSTLRLPSVRLPLMQLLSFFRFGRILPRQSTRI